jgi:hypothetical protein
MQHMVNRPTGARSDKGNKLFNDVISTAENVQFRMNRGILSRNTKTLTNFVMIFERDTCKFYKTVTYKGLNKFYEKIREQSV